ncbi:MAG: prolipoprotein diacylglyceryl transferase [Christensenellales bacterium]
MLVTNNIKIFGLNLSIYGLLMAVGFLLAYFIVKHLFKKRGKINENITLDLLIIILPSSIIGARIYYILFSGRSWTFLEMLQIWNGGLAIYGGIIGGFIALVIYSLVKKINLLDITDSIAVGLIIAQAIGRIGCYFAGCCYGIETVNESLMWFPMSVMIDGKWHLATFFYESLWNILGFISLLIVYNKVNKTGFSTGLYLAIYGFGRFFIEGLRGDSLLIGPFKVSQLLSALVFCAGVLIMIFCFTLNKKVDKQDEQKSSI